MKRVSSHATLAVATLAVATLAVATLGLAAAGCSDPDPCSGQAGACLSVRVEGSGIAAVDTLRVHVSGGAIDATRDSQHARVALPAVVGLVVDPLADATDLALTVEGLLDGAVVGAASARPHLEPKQHLPVTVSLTPGTLPAGGDMASADLTADHAVYDFGGVVSGSASASVTLTFTKSGGDATGALATALEGADAAAFHLDSDGCSGATLAAGESCAVALHVLSSSPSALAATLHVRGTPGGDAAVALSATVLASGNLTVAPVMHAYDPVVANATGADFAFVVTNGGAATTGTLAATLTGSDGASFGFTQDGCTGMTLAGMASCTVKVRFVPTAPGAKQATLQLVASPGGAAVVALSGTALKAATLSAPASVDFSSVVVNAPSAPATVTLTNTGGNATGAIALAVGGANAGEFAISMDTCTGSALAPSASCTLKLTFTPGAPGMRAATLTASATPGAMTTTQLGGIGLAPAALGWTPTSKDFMTVAVAQSSAAQPFTLKNSGAVTSGAITLALTGTNPTDFVTANDTCSGHTLAPMASCTVDVQLKPASYGAKSASLQASASPGGVVPASLSGFGMDKVVLTVNLPGPGGGSVSSVPAGVTCNATACTGSFDRGTSVTLSAMPDGSSQFAGWAGGSSCSGTGTCTVGLDMARSATATFVPSSVTLTVSKILKGAANGTITSSPAGINCGATCSVGFGYNAPVALSVMPAAGSYFTGWGGDCSGKGACMVTMTAAHNVTATFSPANVVFVTSQTYTLGNLASFSVTSPKDGVDGADQKCKALAAAASLPGTFVAFLSRDANPAAPAMFPALNAVDRLAGANGWVRVDGKPVFASASDLADTSGRMFYPIRVNELGADVGGVPTAVATGSTANGALIAGGTCGDWSSTSGSAFGGDASKGTTSWTSQGGSYGCSSAAHLYCFQTDYDVTVTVPAPAAGTRRAFATAFVPGTGGLGDADSACAAAASGRFTGTFKAFLPTATASAASRFNTTTPWVRPDNVAIVAAGGDLLSATPALIAPIDQYADGQYIGEYNVFCGAASPVAAGTAATTCNNWTNQTMSFGGGAGIAARTDPSFFGVGAGNGLPCSYTNGHIYCLQQ